MSEHTPIKTKSCDDWTGGTSPLWQAIQEYMWSQGCLGADKIDAALRTMAIEIEQRDRDLISRLEAVVKLYVEASIKAAEAQGSGE